MPPRVLVQDCENPGQRSFVRCLQQLEVKNVAECGPKAVNVGKQRKAAGSSN